MKRPLKLRKQGNAKSSKSSRRNVRLYSQAFVLIGSGSLILFAVFKLNASMQLDSVLVASQAIYSVIGGVSSLLLGVKQLAQGLVQLVAFALLAILVFTAVLSIGSGVIKLTIEVLPKFSFLWPAAANLIGSILRMVGISDHNSSSQSKRVDRPNQLTVKSVNNRYSIDDLAA